MSRQGWGWDRVTKVVIEEFSVVTGPSWHRVVTVGSVMTRVR